MVMVMITKLSHNVRRDIFYQLCEFDDAGYFRSVAIKDLKKITTLYGLTYGHRRRSTQLFYSIVHLSWLFCNLDFSVRVLYVIYERFLSHRPTFS